VNERQFVLILVFFLVVSNSSPGTLDSTIGDADSSTKTNTLDVLMLGNSYTSQNNLASKL
ncbi:uncharacterized protein METZ01_LOCUS211990, partial [marine metagenome]